MSQQLRLLLIEDSEDDATLTLHEIKHGGYTVYHKRVETAEAMREALDNEKWDIIISDFQMPHFTGFDALEIYNQSKVDIPFILVSGTIGEDLAVNAMKNGAQDYLMKDKLSRLGPAITRELREAEMRRARRRADERVHIQINRLSALRTIDMTIMSSMDLRYSLNICVDQVMKQLGADAVSVLLLNPHMHTLDYAAGQGFLTRGIEKTSLRIGQGLAGEVALSRKPVSLPDLSVSGQVFTREPMAEESFMAYFATPLIAKGQVKGVLEVFFRNPFPANSDWLEFMEMLSGQTAIAIDNVQLFDDLQRSNAELIVAYDDTLEGWSHALDLRDKETEGHTQRVTQLTVKLARGMNVSEEEIVHIRRGALLHDIGKMGIPDPILLKPSKLTDEEWVIMRKHPVYAYEMLSPIKFLQRAQDIPYGHHEKWDGSGYPRGLKGDHIPLAARIFAIVDVWDALRSDRPYRASMPEDQVREHIQKGSGSHFDPRVVEMFSKLQMNK